MSSSTQNSPKVPEAAVKAGDLHNALVYARAHLRTHMDWQAYLNQGGKLPHDLIGDLKHQKKAISELNTICKVLRRFSSEPHIPVSALLSDEVVEAAAKRQWECDEASAREPDVWENARPKAREEYREDARAVLQAAIESIGGAK